MDLVSRHGDGRPHRSWPEVIVTEDPWSFVIRPGSPVIEADGSTWSSPYPVVATFWPERFYQVFMLLKPDVTEYYCNVIAPLWYHADSLQLVFYDLELDVYVSGAGLEIRDAEEFEAARQGYNEAWITGAILAQEELMTLAGEERGVFSKSHAMRWREWIRDGDSLLQD